MQMTELDRLVSHYLDTALWADAPLTEDGDRVDDLDLTHFDGESRDNARRVVTDFMEGQPELIERAYATGLWGDDDLMRDLWLSQNGHGTGFWDRCFGEHNALCNALHEWAKTFGEGYIYDNGENAMGERTIRLEV